VRASERSSRKERYLARHDPLTGLANRTLFQEEFDRVIARATLEQSKAGVVIVDLDRFKDVNDRLGHQFGDVLLVEAARRLRSSFGDCTVARLGGDEFAIILGRVSSAAEIEAKAAELIQNLSEPYALGPYRTTAGASIGIAIYPEDAAEPGKLLRCADIALYKAKAEGRGIFCFYSLEMEAEVSALCAVALSEADNPAAKGIDIPSAA
jgi:diguanylate cyclase (GGDEF)-like protein